MGDDLIRSAALSTPVRPREVEPRAADIILDMSPDLAEQMVDSAEEAIADVAPATVGAAAPVVSAVVAVLALREMGEAILEAESEGRVGQILHNAFSDGVQPQDAYGHARAEDRQLATGLVLSGASHADIERLGRGRTGAFAEALAATREFAAQHPADFREASGIYQGAVRRFQDGASNAVLGLPCRHPQDAAFVAGYDRAIIAVNQGQPWVAPERRAIAAARNEGFIDGARNLQNVGSPIDMERYGRDPGYRAGIEWASDVRATYGDEKLRDMQRALERTTGHGVPVFQVPVRG